MQDDFIVGERIRGIREGLNMNREKFSEMIDISNVFLGQLERGERSLSVKTLTKIVKFTGVSADYILFEKKLELEPFELTKNAFFVRISGEAQQRQEELEAVFGSFDIVKVVEGEFGILTKEMTEAEYMEKAGKITGILNRIRLAN